MTGTPNFAELCAATNFSFLRGASHPEELAMTAAALGLSGFSVCDRNSMAGVVRAHMAAKETGVKFQPGCRLVFLDGMPDLLVWPQDRAAYGRLTRLLTLGNRRAEKGDCQLLLSDLECLEDGAPMALLLPDGLPDSEPVLMVLTRLKSQFGAHLRLACRLTYGAVDQRRLALARQIAELARVPLLATNDVLYHAAERRPLQDVLSCIRLHEKLETAGRRLEANAERHLKPAADMAALFAAAPEALAESLNLLSELSFSLDDLAYEYPEEPSGQSATPQEELERLAGEGARTRYPQGVPDKVQKAIDYELDLVRQLDYAPYFLTVHDIVRFARERGILCQGRGSAANSVVCFCLGITEVDPQRADLLFERFISPERREPPDIDVDFEHERREEVIQYIYSKYGRERAGLAATVITYRTRSALREVGKVFGLSEDAIGALAGMVWGRGGAGTDDQQVREAGMDPSDPLIAQVLELARQLIGFPRHLSQHVGGFVITRGRLDEVVPIQNAAMEDRTVIEWDKDDLDALGILKIDILALGMLSAIRKALEMLSREYGLDYSVSSIPPEDPDVYDMLCEADSVGVFQVESRAQMTMLPRLRPRAFYDLVIEVAIVRPGPIQGDMVHPYLRRRQGLEQVSYPSKELEQVLGKTMGVPLFQEQAMKIAIVAAGFTPSEADRLRRAMATFRRVGTIGTFQAKMIEGMARNGYDREFAERCFRQIEGFGEYGFPESHAASFALLVYASSWIKARYPDVFCAALLNSQPMGFYAPAQLVRDAREHGVEVREVDVNLSSWDAVLEPGVPAAQRVHRRYRSMRPVIKAERAVRLGFRMVKGLKQADLERLIALRGEGYDSVRDLWLRTGLGRSVIMKLAEADAFRSLGLDRRAAIWAAQGLERGSQKDRLPLFDLASHGDLRPEPDADLPAMPPGAHVVADYRSLSLSLKAHPVAFVRSVLSSQKVTPCQELDQVRSGRKLSVAGLVLVRQRPGSAKGVIFMTLEDEVGIANVIVWPKVFEKYRPLVLGARFLKVHGRLQSEAGVIHVVAESVEDVTPLMAGISGMDLKDAGLARADEVKRPVIELSEKIKPASRLKQLVQEVPELRQDIFKHKPHALRQETLAPETLKALPGGRNFH
ncbi:error-prone DNA polymerase, DnaE-like [Roseibium hamelinense]|uniref:Error-prone DNA polymerase n=1 Tax=Roseibium hamelinense TaxID=150831 RepID=A0A562SKK2_9HYPH|nr:error-prone DNA polymerase [Roseibium hamelinense]MTI43260.1 error-prone DNA polymerase [Roseibium hamelinense]TWI81811.1 error-prone DNA polymerase, DnaE-like [Roseibium hamelinense]